VQLHARRYLRHQPDGAPDACDEAEFAARTLYLGKAASAKNAAESGFRRVLHRWPPEKIDVGSLGSVPSSS
jgi:hypothetical protein